MSDLPDLVSDAREEAPARTTLGVARDIVLSLSQMVEDSAELVSATVREELHRFRVELARGALSGVALLVGASFLTAGLAMYVHELLGSWALTLCLFGALYLGIAVALQMRSR